VQTYKIDISTDAFQQIQEAYDYIRERAPQNAAVWLRKLHEDVYSLQTMPERCGLIRENDAFEEDVRQLLHLSHRIIFTVHEDQSLVKVHAIRHAAQEELKGDEF
jgi:plasmid stabilization system protein ParE